MWRRYVPGILDNLIWFILVGVILFFASQTDKFLTPVAFRNVLTAASVLGILVIGQTFVLITGNFDLSAESTLGLAAMVGLWLIVPVGTPTWGAGYGWSPYLAVATILVGGAAIGWLIGALITFGKMNNFIVTLAMLIILRGAMLRFTEGQTVFKGKSEGAESFAALGHDALFSAPWLGKVPVAVAVMLVLYGVAYLVLQHRPFGRELYAIGGNRAAALASGIDPDKRIRQVYTIAGLLAAFGGWMIAGRIGSVQADLGEGYIFDVFAAAVIGGISLQGGRGSIIGALGGVLLLSTITVGLNLMQVSVFWTESIQGLVILVAMFIDAQKVRFRTAPAAVTPTSGRTLGAGVPSPAASAE